MSVWNSIKDRKFITKRTFALSPFLIIFVSSICIGRYVKKKFKAFEAVIFFFWENNKKYCGYCGNYKNKKNSSQFLLHFKSFFHFVPISFSEWRGLAETTFHTLDFRGKYFRKHFFLNLCLVYIPLIIPKK